MVYTQSPLAIGLFVFFVLFVLCLSFYLARRTTSAAGYYAAGGNIHWFTNGIAFAGDHWEKVPQVGSVEIGDDCEIGANTCVDRGAIENTVLEEDVRLDNLCQIGHNVRIGAHSAFAGGSAVGLVVLSAGYASVFGG